MVYDIIIGRSESDRKKLGTRGAIFLGRQYVKMAQTTSLANNVFLDISNAHVIFICGKRGGGKSYTMGVVAEGLADLEPEIKQNLSIIMVDTMGIYWTMKYPNRQDEVLLRKWGLEAKGLDVMIYTPGGYFEEYKRQGVPTDKPFFIRPAELTPEDWFLSFDLTANDAVGVLIERIILDMIDSKENFGIDDIIEKIRQDTRSSQTVRDAAENRFISTKAWGVFSKEGTPIKDLSKGGQVTILDVSVYATMPGGWKIKSLVLGIVAMRLFIERMKARKEEEFLTIESSMHYLTKSEPIAKQLPMIWLVIDEAHEFLPLHGKTAASNSLITILREGRQPGVSLILATQQPGKIHTDVMTQSDILLSHRITAQLDVRALGELMQSYMKLGLDKTLNNLPKIKGAAIILDDSNERMFPIKVRPRFTWHGGSAPTAIPKKKEVFRELEREK